MVVVGERGLTEDVRQDARDLIHKIGDVAERPAVPLSTEEIAEREKALWNWYLEWSSIARSVITDRRMLRSLGFLRYSRAARSYVETDEVIDEPEVEAPDEQAAE